jgi:hypothetical protein
MSLKVSNIIRKLIFTGSLLGAVSAQAQQDSLFLSVEQLFESGIKSSLQLQSDSLKERMAYERKLYAKTGLLPDLEIGLKGGIIGQPVVFQNGLSTPPTPILRTGRRITRSTLTSRFIREEKSAVPSKRQTLKPK